MSRRVLKYIPKKIVEYWIKLCKSDNGDVSIEYLRSDKAYHIFISSMGKYDGDTLAFISFNSENKIIAEEYFFGHFGWCPNNHLVLQNGKEVIQYLKLKVFE